MEKQENKKENKTDNKSFIILMIIGLILFVIGIIAFLFLNRNSIKNGGAWSLIMVGIAFLIIVLAVIFIAKISKTKQRYEPDFRAFFMIGVIWLPLGLALKNHALFIIGIVFMAVGLINKDKWKERKSLLELDGQEKRAKMILVIILGIMALLGLVAYFFAAR